MKEKEEKIQELFSLADPFPHLIIKNLYDEKELELIWEELNFLTKPQNFLKDDRGTDVDENNLPKSRSKSIHLDGIYADRITSNILLVNRKLFEEKFIDEFSKISPMCKSILYQNQDSTKIRYYEDEDEYLPHVDIFNYTAITFFFREPKLFEGGDLYFPDFDYYFNCNNNHTILFPSCILHAAKKVFLKEKFHCSGKGRYSMMQFLKLI